MTLSKNTLMISALALALAVTGCANRKPAASANGSATAGSMAGANGSNGASSSGLGNSDGLNGQGMGANGAMDGVRQALAARVVHFDYDSSELSNDDYQTLQAHAQFLMANANSKVALTGHTDERGTREYNMALGERRAKAVQRYLVLQGVSPAQLELVSYGKERPIATGNDEQSWAQNRRVELRK